MRTRTALHWAAAVTLLSSVWQCSFAQTAATAPPPPDRLDKLEDRLNQLEADVKSRDEEIARLKSQLNQTGATQPAAAPAAPPPTHDEIERTKQDVLKDLESHEATPLTLRTPANFNPDLAVVIDALGSWSNQRSNNAYNRFDVREAELDLRGAIDPRADGVLVLAFPRDVDNFPFPEGGDAQTSPETGATVEEAYAFFHDFGVPNLTAKLGRFHLRFGRQNILHLHDLPTSDPPLVNQAFLAPEALTDAGLSLSYVIPPAMIGNQYVEVVAEVITGEGADSASPTLTGDLTVDSPALNVHALWNHDITRDINLELGASWLTSSRSADTSERVNLIGGDVTLVRTDPTGRFNNQLLQAEVMHAIVDQPVGGATQHAWGAYLLAQQQIHKDWYAGARLDWTENPNDDSQEIWAVSPYVSWYWSEFLRLRMEYQHRGGDPDNADVVYFQATFIFGAHPPHPYWAMR